MVIGESELGEYAGTVVWNQELRTKAAHDRRCTLSINVTSNPSASWTANQLVQAFPWESAPRYLLRDRDGIYGDSFSHRVHNLGIEEVIIARRSPWQNPYVERVIGTLVAPENPIFGAIVEVRQGPDQAPQPC
jgi:hypothetical protein